MGVGPLPSKWNEPNLVIEFEQFGLTKSGLIARTEFCLCSWHFGIITSRWFHELLGSKSVGIRNKGTAVWLRQSVITDWVSVTAN